MAWRILHNSIPLRANLFTRGVWCIPICPRCWDDIETTYHALEGHNKFGYQTHVAESLGLRLGLQFARELIFLHLQVELNSLNVISAMNKDSVTQAYFGMIISNCKQIKLVSLSKTFFSCQERCQYSDSFAS